MAKCKIWPLDGENESINKQKNRILICRLVFSLGPLVGKVKDYQVEVIVDTLCSNMVGDNEQLRDISSIGLKTVINELPLTTQTLAATGKSGSLEIEFFDSDFETKFQFARRSSVGCRRRYHSRRTSPFSSRRSTSSATCCRGSAASLSSSTLTSWKPSSPNSSHPGWPCASGVSSPSATWS